MKVSKFRGLIAVTLCLIVITVSAIVYEKSMPKGRQDGQGSKMFRLYETEPSEPYLELKHPLDNWTAQAIQNLTQCVTVKEQYWNQCQITNSTAKVFKYGEKFYAFTRGMWTSRHIDIHVDPLNEVNCGVAISLCKITYSPSMPCYELHDPLDPWTEAAIEDPINIVWVDDIYQDRCALFEPNITTISEQQAFFRYDGEYYTIDQYGFYDDFSSFRNRFIRPLIIICWIFLGCFWLGSGLYELKKSKKTLNRNKHTFIRRITF